MKTKQGLATAILVLSVAASIGSGFSLAQASENGRIAYSADNDIYAVDPDGRYELRLTDGNQFSNAVVNESPSWSADGSRLAYAQASMSSIFLMNANGDGKSEKFVNQRVSTPDWLGKGPYVAFSSNGTIYKAKVTNGSRTRLIYKPGWTATMPQYSPDGRWIAFIYYSNPSHIELHTANARGTADQRIVTNTSHITKMSWSPSSGRLAYVASDSQIHTISSSGGADIALTNAPYSFGNLSWSPDGTKIVAEAKSGSAPANLAIVDATTGAIQSWLTQTPNIDESSPDWAVGATVIDPPGPISLPDNHLSLPGGQIKRGSYES